MSARIRAGIVALALLFPVSASANWFRPRPQVVAAYYCPSGWVPAYRAYYLIPVGGTPAYYFPTGIPTARPFAAPTAAPPSRFQVNPGPSSSTTREPPRVTESRSSSPKETREPPLAIQKGSTSGKDVSLISKNEKPTEECCRVGFLNLSPRDLVIKIDGSTQNLPSGKKLAVVVKKQFVWQIVGSEAQLERVPEDKTALEIVIRR